LEICKNASELESFIVARVESFGKKRDFSQAITTSFLNVTRVESPKFVTRVRSLTLFTPSLH